MSRPRPITIAGGGLAGLALGIGLRHRGVPVTILEAGGYPRHRVCGEFISGVDPSTLEALGITRAFAPQTVNRDSRWFYRGRPILAKMLPAPAMGISRHHLDAWLAREFVRLGGELHTHTRANADELPPEGSIWSAGRQRAAQSEWLGLKCHVRGLGASMDTGLQMHFGDGCYVGLCRVEAGTVNVCGIFRRRREIRPGGRLSLLDTYLRRGGLAELAGRLGSAEMDPASLLGVSAFQLGRQPAAARGNNFAHDRLRIGDAWSMIPPFTGNGMSMAFQSAEIALAPLVAYAGESSTWPEAVARIRASLHRRFDRRIRWGMAIHPFLLRPAGQRTFLSLARLRAVPFRLLFKLTR